MSIVAANTAPARRPLRIWALRLLPLLPISLALAAPLVARQFQQPAPAPSAPLQIGSQAPDFSLRDAQAKDADPPVSLSRLASRGPVVIIFHRGLSCGMCVLHLQQIAEHSAEFKAAGISVVAIGPDPLPAMRDAAESMDPIPFPLLSDPDDDVARAFGLQTPDGHLFHGTFVVDKNRRLLYAEASDAPVGDADTLLQAAKQ